MQVLEKVCPRCGYVQHYSVAVLSQPESAEQFGIACPACGRQQSPAATATEIDQPELAAPVDEAAIARSIARFTGGEPPPSLG